jgi:hypothetical protein
MLETGDTSGLAWTMKAGAEPETKTSRPPIPHDTITFGGIVYV